MTENGNPMERRIVVELDLTTLLLLQEVVGFAGFHDPILGHLTDRQQQVLWEGTDRLADALREAGIEDWDGALADAEKHWDSRHGEA